MRCALDWVGTYVLAHKNNTLATELLSDLLHLAGAYIVSTNNDDLRVLLDQSNELLEVLRLLRTLIVPSPRHLLCIRFLKGFKGTGLC